MALEGINPADLATPQPKTRGNCATVTSCEYYGGQVAEIEGATLSLPPAPGPST